MPPQNNQVVLTYNPEHPMLVLVVLIIAVALIVVHLLIHHILQIEKDYRSGRKQRPKPPYSDDDDGGPTTPPTI